MENAASLRPIEILLVEDNPGDIRLTQEMLKDARLCNRLSVVTDGEEALAFVRRERPYADAVRPDLVLLDLDLPRKDGWQVLAELRADAALANIPVIVLTASLADTALVQDNGLRADACLMKPVDLAQLVTFVQRGEQFGLAIVALPTAAPIGARCDS